MSPSREIFPSDSFSKSLTSAVRWLSLGHISVLQYINGGPLNRCGRGSMKNLWREAVLLESYGRRICTNNIDFDSQKSLHILLVILVLFPL